MVDGWWLLSFVVDVVGNVHPRKIYQVPEGAAMGDYKIKGVAWPNEWFID
jgi:hypothetical protein